MNAPRLPNLPTVEDPMTVAVFVAVVVHLAIGLGVSFERSPPPPATVSSLDIVLVQARERAAEPDDAQMLAQRNTDGGADTDARSRPTTPLPSPLDAPRAEAVASAPLVPPAPATPEPAPATASAPEPVQAPAVLNTTAAATTEHVAAAIRPRPRARPRDLRPPPPTPVASTPAPATPPVSAAQIVTQGLAMASLTSELDQRVKAYTSKPRRKWISSRTREVKYAAYMEAWRSKVERVGNLNYPDEARRARLSGKLQLDVALKPDGSIHGIAVRRSSGKRVLDDAAVRIVKLAAPFSPFPPSFRDDIDVLHIERTWQFLDSNRLASR